MSTESDSAARPAIAAAALALVLEGLPYACRKWRLDQLLDAACASVELPPDHPAGRALRARLIKELKFRGKHEYEVWAIEDVLIEIWRARHCT